VTSKPNGLRRFEDLTDDEQEAAIARAEARLARIIAARIREATGAQNGQAGSLAHEAHARHGFSPH
jgi:hypothetical protein